MQFHHLLSGPQFEERFGAIVGSDGRISCTERDLLGESYRTILTEMVEIVSHQWRSAIRHGAIKGFFLSGPPGIGKTSMAMRVAHELGLRFREEAPDAPLDGQVVLALIDGGDIARSRYGESEERIGEVFARAQKGFSDPRQRSIVLFDDVESILMARGTSNAKEWHFSQDSVFFHAVDELDTSRAAVFLTSNRPDLVDEAIADRFLSYSLDRPDAELLVEVALRRAVDHSFNEEQLARLRRRVRETAAAGGVRSVRDAERLVARQYVEDILGRASIARSGEA